MINFKVDTGAAVTAVPSTMTGYLPEITSSSKTLRGAGNHKLDIEGSTKVTLKIQDKMVEDTIYIVNGLVEPLLGKPAISGLGLIQFIDEVNDKSAHNWCSEFPKLFQGLGEMGSEVRISLQSQVKPFTQSVPRRVPAARKKPLLDELCRMEKLGVIQKIEEPTDWCSPIVVVPKKNERIRVCIDFTRLNEAVRREYHPLPTTEETLSELGSANVFSKLDANCGYWQMRLHEDSQKLTTFITPFGRYFCKRLPFGISSAPEIFQREMQKVVMDLPGVVCQMDDILIYGSDQTEHDERVRRVLQRLEETGITLNKEKCEFSRNLVKFLGHIVNGQGIQADPEKTRAIVNFPTPGNRKELRRFFGIVNYLGKFSASLSVASVALRQLLGKDIDWIWSKTHDNEFNKLKQIISSTPTLTPFQLSRDTMLSTDASSYGLGAALLQRVGTTWKPIAYASRSMNSTEKRYAQIEKEALAICWACDKFNYYLSGRKFEIETDHQPLVSVLGSKELAKLPLRVQRFRLKMMNYCYTIRYTPGHKLVLADALSRAPLVTTESMTYHKSGVLAELVSSLSVSRSRRERIKASMLEDNVGLSLVRHISHGWPNYSHIEDIMKPYYSFRDYLTYVDGMVFYQSRLFIPELERDRILSEIHAGHQGETKCIQRAVAVVWWPGMTKDIRNVVRMCSSCEEHRRKPPEPLITSPLPERPWWRLAIDLFQKDGKNYLVVVDYYSRYITVDELNESTETHAIIRRLERTFCLLGIPNTVVSDCGPQFTCELFQKFVCKWDIHHITSSPRFPQSNGEAERAVQTAKGLMKKNVSIQAALCAYRDTPLANGYSPAQLMFGRGLNSLGMIGDSKIDTRRLRSYESERREKQAKWFNARHRAKERSPIRLTQPVVIREPGNQPRDGTVIATKGREVVAVGSGQQLIRRNRSQVSRRSTEMQSESPTESMSPSQQGVTLPANVNTPPVTAPPLSRTPSPRAVSSSPQAPTTMQVNRPRSSLQPPSEPEVRYTRSGRISKPPSRLNL